MALVHKRDVLTHRTLLTISGMICGLLSLFFFPMIAQAHPVIAEHAEYVSSTPATNAMLKTAPSSVAVHFSEDVNPAGSNITIYDVNGKQVSTADATVDRSDLKTMTVPLQADASEIYVVNWHTVSAVEGHHDSGSFRFFVNISPMLQGMVSGHMTGMAGSQNMANSSNTSASSSSSAVPLWSAGLIGLIGLLVGGGSMFAFLESRQNRRYKKE